MEAKEPDPRAGDRLVAATVRRGGPWPVVLAVASVAGAACELALPFAAGRTIDGFVTAAPGRVTWLAVCAALVAGVIVCETAAVWARGASGAHASARLRRAVVRHVLGAGLAVRGRFAAGDLVTRAGMNAEEVGRAPESVVGAVALLVPTAGGLVALTLIDPLLTLALAGGIAVVLLVLRAFLRAGTAIAGGYQEEQGRIAARLLDALEGVRTIAAAGTERRETRRVLASLPRLRAHGMDLWRATADAGAKAGVMVPVVELAVLAVGGLRLAGGDLTVGELYAAARYAVLGLALSTVLGYAGGLARARSAAGRVAEVLAVPSGRHGTRTLPEGPGTLEFTGVSAPGLAIGDLVVAGGSTTAVVGRSGSGKSLLAALAGRLADPEHGTVTLDGVPLADLSRAELRHAVGFAFARPALFGGTLEEAIGLEASYGRTREAAVAACADGFIRRLPEGYATPPAEAPMSGGERQRIGLARAFAQAERLLVLDDATSSLDTVTERRVSDALTGGAGAPTRLIVAHRPGTAARADRVIWLHDGRVRAHAPHRELWRDPGYRAVFRAAESPVPEGEGRSGPPDGLADRQAAEVVT
ncbi:ABC transporter ATP-binding protein [Spongiactinospora sp. TRM90649]|uniref:ABC transporter ATP-binding protein n=1 Tax=Spongiactinospora sp. TRM90649 TaxID=3031114 RepID=UPI0023F9E02F|nr:ABC transporter ATP-binding protein [Spongiactinospora sp. TRM90649]MDF5752288.1 ABC transporter ATP-binding protein [Spongiactinospora sp. TRM90649]